MVVCSCHHLSERLVREAIAAGATSVQDVMRALCAQNPMQCGMCFDYVLGMIEDARDSPPDGR